MNKINPLIFRAYDIRGVYPTDINEEFAYILGRSFGTYISNMGMTKAVIGYDNRESSPILCDSLIKGITSTGVDVIKLGLVTTPMFYFARYHLNIWSGIMITASHNPSDHNGFKMSFDNKGNALGDEIKEFYNFTVAGEFKDGNGKIEEYDIKEEYIKNIKESLQFGDKKIKVVVDCGNGTVGNFIDDILRQLPIEYKLLYAESDPTFPNHHPDPSVPENMRDLQKTVVELGYDLGIGLDADGDRVGIVDNLGNIISSDLFLVIMYRFLQDKLEDKTALYDVKCSKALVDDLERMGYNQIMYRTGNSYLYRKTHEEDIALSGEYSGHIFFNDRYPGIDDGIYAGLRMAEVLSITGKTIRELLEGVNKYYSTPEIKITVSDTAKFELMNTIKENVKKKDLRINDIDGVRIEGEDYWVLIRVSNTTPSLTLRFEAKSEKMLDQIKKEYTDLINNIMKEKGL